MRYVPSHPIAGQRILYQSQGVAQALSATQMGQRGQNTIRGQGQGSQARSSKTQGRVYAIVPPIEPANRPALQGMFLLSRMWVRVLFDSGASHSFIPASCVRELGLEVKTLEEPMHVSSP